MEVTFKIDLVRSLREQDFNTLLEISRREQVDMDALVVRALEEKAQQAREHMAAAVEQPAAA